MPIINGIVYGKDTRSDFLDVSSFAQSAHDVMANTFTESNLLYSKSSVVEDIILNKFLSIYNTARSININNILRKNYILESFTSQDYIDLKFPVDNLLNLDTQNGSLTLPVQDTTTLIADSIIIETDSNGQPGNAYAYDNSNADPKVILTADNATLFEYEKVSNIFSTTTLFFSATIKLKEEGVANGCYIRLYADDGNNYPVVDTVDISQDGKDWVNVNRTIEVNKADHFIRFMPKRIRFIRVRLKQENYSVLKTAFGPKYRYVIGIREISAKQTSYKDSGEYISVPFTSRKLINGVAFNEDSISFNDISYYISANNGAKWVEIKDTQVLDINSADMGMRGEIDVTQIRVKVKMDRVRSPNAASAQEYIVTNTTDQYFLKHKPIELNAYLGNHISYGTAQKYTFTISSTSQLDQNALQPGNCIQAGYTMSATLFYVPFTESLLADTELRLNGALLKNDGSVYNFIQHANPEHSVIVMRADLLGSNLQSATVDMVYKPFLYDHRYTKNTGSRIVLPQNAFVETQEGITIEQINYNPVSMDQTNAALLLDNQVDTLWESTLVDPATEWVITANKGIPFTLASYMITPYITVADGAKFCPSIWKLEASNDLADPWVVLDTQDHSDSVTQGAAFWASNEPLEFSLSNQCQWMYYKLTVLKNCANDPVNAKKLKIINLNFYDAKVTKISDVSMYTVIPKKATENTVVLLSDAIYNPECDYRITYYPSVPLNAYMPKTWTDNSISMQAVHHPPIGSKVCFEYTYEDSTTIRDINFYTPVCHEYRVELI